MECHSCGRPTVAAVGRCQSCGARLDGADRDRSVTGILVTDGGQGSDDDPLAPADDESEPEADEGTQTPPEDGDDEEYLEPEEIVGDDLDDGDSTPDSTPDQGSPESGGESTPDPQPQNQPPDSSQPQGGPESAPSAADQQTDGEPSQDAAAPGDAQPQDGHQPDDTPAQGPPGASDSLNGQPRQESQAAGGEPGQHQQADQNRQSGTADTPQGGDRPRQGSQPGSYAQGGGGTAGETSTDTTNTGGQFLEQMGEFPLKIGAGLGAVAFFVPYLLITIASYWAYEETPTTDPELSAFDVGAEVFMTTAGFGSGDRIVDLFIGMTDTDVTSPGEIDPSNYPTVEDELGPLLSLFDSSPEVPLLIVYILAPYVLFVSGRYLARHYSPSPAPVDRMVSGMTVVLGTLPIVFLVGLVFDVFALLERLIFVGIFVPGVVGALGGLSIWLFDEQSALVSSLVGWLSIGASVAVGAVLLPLPNLDLGGSSLALSFLDRLVVALGSYLNVLEFNMGAHNQGRLYFIIVALVTIAAGFLRVWRLDTEERSRMYAAVAGSSIWLGFVATIALFLWVFPMSTIFVDVGFESALFGGSETSLTIQSGAIDGSVDGAPIPTIERVVGVDSYLHSIVVGGFVFPAMFGGIGGYIAAWFNER